MKTKIAFIVTVLMVSSAAVDARGLKNKLNTKPSNVEVRSYRKTLKYLVDMTYYHADNSPFERYVYSYDTNGLKKKDVLQFWNDTRNDWTDNTKTEYVFENNILNSIVTSSLGTVKWNRSSKTEYAYDAAGRKIASMYYSWDDASESWAFKPSSKCTWDYDDNGILLKYSEQWADKKTGELADITSQILYFYDKEGNLSSELLQEWNFDTKSWRDAGKYEYEYSNDKVICNSYIASGENWIYDGKIICYYDEDGYMARCEYYTTDINDEIDAYCVYNYSTVLNNINVPNSTEIKTYPNPVTTDFEIILPESLIGKTAMIFSSNGQQVKNFVVGGTRMKINVSGFTSGIYVIKIDDYSKKILIK